MPAVLCCFCRNVVASLYMIDPSADTGNKYNFNCFMKKDKYLVE